MVVRTAPARLVLGILALTSAEPALAARDWYELRGVQPPRGDRVYICHGYMCRIVSPVSLSPGEIERIAGPLADALTPAAEREAISAAVQAFETIVGARVGTAADLPKMQFGRGKPDQMDCIDEATNTTSLLRLLAERGSIRHHRVLQPSARGFFLDGRYPHATAVLAEVKGGAKWAVDSWPRANGEAPVVQPLRDWQRSREAVPPS